MPSIHTALPKKSYFLKKKIVKTWLVPVDVSIVEAVRGVSVSLPSPYRRRAPYAQTHVPTHPPLLFFVVVHGAVLTGTATFFFFFFTQIAIHRPGTNQNCYGKSHVVCIVTGRVHAQKTPVGHQAANCPKAGTPTW